MNRTRVRAIIEHDGKILLVRNLSSPDFWCLPGGKVEPSEDIISAIARELLEETGVQPVIGNVIFIHQFASDQGYETPEFFIHVKNGNDYIDIDLNKTSHGQKEIAEIKFMDVAHVNVLPRFLQSEIKEVIENNFSSPVIVKLSSN